MKKINDRAPRQSRRDLANPHKGRSRAQRLIDSGAGDLKENFSIESFGNGYGRIRPIDPDRKIR